MQLLKALGLTLALLFTSGLSVSAATSVDPVLYKDLAADTSHTLAGFNVPDAVAGTASLSLRYGGWNGNGAFTLIPVFNGTSLSALSFDNSYYSTPGSFNWDVTSLIQTGVNTLTVSATNSGSAGSTYSIGEATLEYATAASPVPLPAGGLMLVSGLIALGLRRKRAA